MSMNPKHFQQYVTDMRGISDRTASHYTTGLKTINLLLKKEGYPITDLFSVGSIDDLDDIKQFLNSCKEFNLKDNIGHRMYSVAFKHFYRYAYRHISSEK